MCQVTGETGIVKELLGHSTMTITEQYTLGHLPAYIQVPASRFRGVDHCSSPARGAAPIGTPTPETAETARTTRHPAAQ